MKVVVTINNLQNRDSGKLNQAETMLAGSYPMGNQVRIMYDKLMFDDYPATPPKDKPNPAEFNINFSANNQSYVIEYEVDKEGKPKEQLDKLKHRLVENFFKHHPLCIINGVAHERTVVPLFDITDKATQITGNLRKWDIKRRIANFLAEADLEQVRDILFYYGVNPKNMSKGEICILLADYVNGTIYAPGAVDLAEQFMTVWVAGQSEETKVLVNIRKAISMKIIEQRGAVAYYLNGVFIGTNSEEIAGYFRNEPKIYNEHVVRKITDQDHFADELLLTGAEKLSLYQDAETGKIETDKFRQQVQDLVKECNDAGIQHGYAKAAVQGMGVKKLRDTFDILTKLKKEAEVSAV